MAEFKVTVQTIDEVTAHPNADRLDVARIGGWQIVVGKGQHKAGEQVAYIPEQALILELLQKRLGVEGRLAGSKKNRVKAIKLRGVLSQGLVLPLKEGHLTHPETNEKKPFKVGDDVTAFLNITKYEPPVPMHIAGEMYASPLKLPRYDVENWKSNPEAIPPGTPVLITEKLHGTLSMVVFYGEEVIISSKGLAAKDMALKQSDKNLYHRVITPHLSRIKSALQAQQLESLAFGVIGEIVGPRVQDLQYGHTKPEFYLFEVIVQPTEQSPWEYADFKAVQSLAQSIGLKAVPLIGETTCPGPNDIERANKLADGKTAIPNADHIREGVVLRTPKEARNVKGERLLRKIVSGAYLTRKKGTEHQ